MSTDFLIVANGEAHDGHAVRETIASLDTPTVVAVDGGASIAQKVYNLTPHVVIGDLDSLTHSGVNELHDKAVMMHVFPTEKDKTDLELAIDWVVQQGARRVRLISAIGGRIDQTLANVFLLARPDLIQIDFKIVSAQQQVELLRAGQHHMTGRKGDTLSLIPLTDSVKGITTSNLTYSLLDKTLTFGTTRGISNVLNAELITITIRSGLLLVVHTYGKA